MLEINTDSFVAKHFYKDFLPGLSSLSIHRNNNRLAAFNVVTTQLQQLNNNPVYGAGGSMCIKGAIIASIGEGIERQCLYTPLSDLRYAAYEDIYESAIDPTSLYHFHDKVYEKLNIDQYCPQAGTFWHRGRNLLTGGLKYIPACSIWTNFNSPDKETPVWDRPVSTGTSCHFNKNKSILSGILEVIERDTFSLYWENNISGVHRELPKEIKKLQEYLKANQLESEIVALPNEFGVPVACCLIKDNSGYGPLAAFGAAAKLSWTEAALRATEEAILTTLWLTSRIREQHKSYENLMDSLSGLPDPVVHADIYASYPLHEYYMPLFDECNLYGKNLPDVFNFEQLIERISSAGYEIYIVDITLPEFIEMGYTVNRIIIPGLVPLSRGFFLRHVKNTRHGRILNDCIMKNQKKNYFVQPLP